MLGEQDTQCDAQVCWGLEKRSWSFVFVQMGVELSTRHITRTRKGRNKERRRDGEKISLQDKGKSAVTKWLSSLPCHACIQRRHLRQRAWRKLFITVFSLDVFMQYSMLLLSSISKLTYRKGRCIFTASLSVTRWAILSRAFPHFAFVDWADRLQWIKILTPVFTQKYQFARWNYCDNVTQTCLHTCANTLALTRLCLKTRPVETHTRGNGKYYFLFFFTHLRIQFFLALYFATEYRMAPARDCKANNLPLSSAGVASLSGARVVTSRQRWSGNTAHSFLLLFF